MSSIRSIVVAVDFSGPSRAAVKRASALAKQAGAAIHLIHAARLPVPVVSHEFAIPGPAWESVRDDAQKKLERVAAELRKDQIEVSLEVNGEDPADAIRSAAEAHHADLVVMGTHGHRGVEHFILGSVAERVVRTCGVPVMAVKGAADKAADPIERIVVATDYSDHANAAMDYAIDLAKALNARIDLVHAFTLPAHYFTPYGVAPPDGLVNELVASAESMLAERSDSVSRQGVEVESHFVTTAPSSAIAEVASKVDADAIVMGTRGNTGLKHVFLGSVAERTLRVAPCSVIVVGARHPISDEET